MKFLSISYSNYRCFKDVEIKFNTTPEKNIALVIAPNGGGKTEMLFSFWWVLYGFDFRDLKEKSDAPFSLNLAKYNKLKRSQDGCEESCSVALKFVDGNKTYLIKKTEIFTKRQDNISSRIETAMAYKEKNGETTIPIRNKDDIYRSLSKIIPPRILHGIVFDGERMKQLSSADENTKEAIQGIIKDITNEELFERCRTELDDLKRENSREEKKVSASFKNVDVEGIISEINADEEIIKNSRAELKEHKELSEKYNIRLREISRELKADETARNLESERDKLRERLKIYNKSFDGYVQSFADDLYEAYLMMSNDIFDDIENSLKRIDIPDGLTSEAVESILKKNVCICGHPIGEEERKILEQLADDLPPGNAASTILEMTRQAKEEGSLVKKKLMKSFSDIKDTERTIKETKEKINTISSQITGEGFTARAAKLNYEMGIVETEKKRSERVVENATSLIGAKEKEIETLKKQKNLAIKGNQALKYYSDKESLISRFKEALDEIDKINGQNALMDINEKLEKAYSQISEDYERGRRVHIVQYDRRNKYRLVSYYANDYSGQFLNDSSYMEELKAQGKSSDEIKEALILKICQPNSTGQSKINTLAFAKAILDYSNIERDEDSFEISKNYPFLIDSPFTELSGGNLEQSSVFIHTFAKQILLFISEDSYKDVKDNVEPYVSSITKLQKHESESYSFVVGGEK